MEAYINVPGGKIWYKVVGQKKKIPLVVLHGGPGFPHDYLEVLENLGDEREIIFYDQLGCGKSDRPDDPHLWTVERFVEELEEIVRFLGFSEYHVLGQSWGAALAVSFALKQPAGLKSIILADPYLSSPLWMKDAERLKTLLPKDTQEIMARHEREGTVESVEYGEAIKKYNDAFVLRLASVPEAIQRSEDGMSKIIYRTMWGFKEPLLTGTLKEFDLADRLHEVLLPVLLLCGRYDEATPESTRYFQTLFPNARMEIFEKSAHLPFLSETREFLGVVRKFFQEID